MTLGEFDLWLYHEIRRREQLDNVCFRGDEEREKNLIKLEALNEVYDELQKVLDYYSKRDG